jgi:TPR repeat protein
LRRSIARLLGIVSLGIVSLLIVGCREIDVARIKAYLGSSDAQLRLAYLYGTGENVELDQAAATSGIDARPSRHPLAQVAIGNRDLQGVGVEQDAPTAALVPARCGPGRRRGPGAARHHAREARDRAQRRGGAALPAPRRRSGPSDDVAPRVHVLVGHGVEADEKAGFEWVRKAAEANYAGAQIILARHYAVGKVVAKDDAEAVRWYRKAAEQGSAEAQLQLGLAYEKGEGVEKDPAAAVEWLTKAAEQGDALAQQSLGSAYAKGQGVPVDFTRAAEWYRRAADQGLPMAQYNVGYGYAFGWASGRTGRSGTQHERAAVAGRYGAAEPRARVSDEQARG